MARDFTGEIFERLLRALLDAGYVFVPFERYVSGEARPRRVVILRHDVDRRPAFSVRAAEIESALGIEGTYYFRIVPESYDEAAIERIAGLGHEVGYHYEDLTLAGGDAMRAIALFERHLARLRGLCSIRTLCMHGSPLSRYDNRRLWERYDYRDYDLVGEPYFDIDFSRVFYLTDTGRRWDGDAVSVRDRAPVSAFGLRFQGTREIIEAAASGGLPDHLMITTHPQRWTDSLPAWTLELVGQSVKNLAKGALNAARRTR